MRVASGPTSLSSSSSCGRPEKMKIDYVSLSSTATIVLVIDIELPEAPLATITLPIRQTLMTTLPMMNPKHFETIHETRVRGDVVSISAFFVQVEATREGEAGIHLQLVQAKDRNRRKNILTNKIGTKEEEVHGKEVDQAIEMLRALSVARSFVSDDGTWLGSRAQASEELDKKTDVNNLVEHETNSFSLVGSLYSSFKVVEQYVKSLDSSVKDVESLDNSVKHMETQMSWCSILKQVKRFDIMCKRKNRESELKQRSRSTSPEFSSSSSCSSVSYSPKLEIEEEEKVHSENAEETKAMDLVGCPRCFMYVMLSEKDPKCPKCKSTVLGSWRVVMSIEVEGDDDTAPVVLLHQERWKVLLPEGM
ncbi:hypothetical protein V8G54_026110 [Vigna mungo]|uniref:GIR1-like zinc ribbon domain-containing protein n=1 Tax=Vigna mungo TaxID=3915 RepID=A0AAQ3MZU3_VIGMU